ncbi:kinase-like protein, partial [Peniophora sp. CONT]
MRASASAYLPLCEPTRQSINSGHVRVTRLLRRDSSLLECRSPRVAYRRLGELYAVKSVRLGATPAERATQLREVVMHERVSGKHENIVGLRDCFFDSHHLYFVLDGIFGGDLQEAIAERAPFFYDDGATRSVFTQVVDAVAFCHSQTLFHRNIKPSNILCSMDGKRIFLSNFGLATEKEESDEFGIGTLPYMCPEAINPGRELECYSTRQGDLWAIGILLVDMLTGRTPWSEATVADADFRLYLQSPSCSLNGLPISPDVKRLIQRVLHHNSAKRISAYELLARLPSVQTFFPTKEEL